MALALPPTFGQPERRPVHSWRLFAIVAHLKGDRVVQIIEQCNCGSTHTRWEELNGSASDPNYSQHSFLRCMRCGNTLRERRNFPWVFFLLATAAAIAGWFAVFH